MTYFTLQYNGVEKSLADWLVSTWRREAHNQASDSFAFNLLAAADAAEIFPYGAQIVIRIGRTPAAGPNAQPNGTPVSGVTSWTGGTTWFVGYRVSNIRTGSAQLEQFAYKFAGPWDFFLERLVFQKLWLTWNGTKQIADWRSQVVLGMSVTALSGAGDTVPGTVSTNLMSIAQQLKEIAAYAVAQSTYEQSVNGLGWSGTAQFQFDTLTSDTDGNYYLLTAPSANCGIPDFVPGFVGTAGDTSASTSGIILRAPLDAVNDITCAEAIRKELRWIGAIGSPVCWWDYTQTPPMLKISTRDQLSAIDLPVPTSMSSIKIQRRDDLIPPAVHFKYRISGQINGSPYSVVQNDIAATVSGTAYEGVGQFGVLETLAAGSLSGPVQTALPLQARRFAAQIATFDFEGISVNSATAIIATTAIGDLLTNTANALWPFLFPELVNAGSLSFYNGSSPAPKLLMPDGSAVDLTAYPNILTEGHVTAWMPGDAVEATLTAYFTYNEQALKPSSGSVETGGVQYHEKTVKVKLTSLAGGTYHSAPSLSGGEAVPYGLAGYVYGIEKIPQYQGTVTFQEQDITDLCPLGNNLNLTNSLAEWSSMNACVQSITYDDTSKTELTFGPAQHLGAVDLVERLRVNRGPRWLYLIGHDLLNANDQSGPLELGQNMPKQSASPGAKVEQWKVFPEDLTDWQAHSYTQPPGVILYNAAGGGPDDGPGVFLSTGSAGSVDAAIIQISVAQLKAIVSGKAVCFREFGPYVDCAAGTSNNYFTYLGTVPYTK